MVRPAPQALQVVIGTVADQLAGEIRAALHSTPPGGRGSGARDSTGADSPGGSGACGSGGNPAVECACGGAA